MPHYFFHVVTSEGVAIDPEGQDLAGPEAARTEAILASKEAMADHLMGGGSLQPFLDSYSIAVSDVEGVTVLTVDFREAADTGPALSSAVAGDAAPLGLLH